MSLAKLSPGVRWRLDLAHHHRVRALLAGGLCWLSVIGVAISCVMEPVAPALVLLATSTAWLSAWLAYVSNACANRLCAEAEAIEFPALRAGSLEGGT